jgi:hypothetical protein
MLAQENLQHDAVDGAVRRVERDRANDRALLAEAVDATLALLMAGRIPGEVVMDDGVKTVLEVDALAQAVSSDEDVLFM